MPQNGSRILFTAIFCGAFFFSFSASSQTTLVIQGDVEGDWERFSSFFPNSGAFETGRGGELKIKEGFRFINMGDLTDRGSSSLAIMDVLNQLRENQKEQYIQLLGNRDLKTLRFLKELSPEGLLGLPNEEVAKKPFRQWIEGRSMKVIESFSDPAVRLQWILAETMGAPTDFDFRKAELRQTLNREPTLDEVTQSYRDQMSLPNGKMAKTLLGGQIGYLDKANRAFFVHGGVLEAGLGALPGVSGKIQDLDYWVGAVNQQAQHMIRKGLLNGGEGAEDLIAYQQPLPGTVANDGSLVYARNFDDTGNPAMIWEQGQQYFLDQGVDTLFVAHTPVGEVPVVVANDRFRIVFMDTSYSQNKNSPVVTLRDGVLSVSADSLLSEDGKRFSYTHKLGQPSRIGTKGSRGWIVEVGDKTQLELFIDKENNFEVSYQEMPQTPLKVLCPLSK